MYGTVFFLLLITALAELGHTLQVLQDQVLGIVSRYLCLGYLQAPAKRDEDRQPERHKG